MQEVSSAEQTCKLGPRVALSEQGVDMRKRLPIVGVLGSGNNEHATRAAQVGNWFATQPVHLLTGGGGGVMTAVSRAFQAVPTRVGLVVGIIPCSKNDPAVPKAGCPNPYVELAIMTHLPLSGAEGTDERSRSHKRAELRCADCTAGTRRHHERGGARAALQPADLR